MRQTILLVGCVAAALAAGSAQALTWGTFGSWDSQARRDAADAAMQRVTDRFNAYGDFNWGNDGFIDVYYSAGVPTAQASYYGAVTFGGTWPADRVTQHEVNHWLGSGFAASGWEGQFVNNAWVGAEVKRLMRQFDGAGASFFRSGVHFYPYGLNFDSEVVNDATYMRNVALMYAMRQDMGNGNPADPWSATSVTLSASDPVGTSAFNWAPDPHTGGYQGWDDGYFAHPGAAYSTGDYTLRTPQHPYSSVSATPSFAFHGDSLTVNNTNGVAGGLLYKGVGTSGVLTFKQLILDGGYVRHASGAGDLMRIAGAVTVAGSPTIDAAQGDIRIAAPISGAGSLNLKSSGRTITLVSDHSDYAGDTNVQGGTLQLHGATGLGLTTLQGDAAMTGAGRVRGGLTALSGASIRVGGDGLAFGLAGGLSEIDAFNNYSTGLVDAGPNVTNGAWTGVYDGGTNAEVIANGRDRALRTAGTNLASGWRGAVTNLGGGYDDDFSLAHGETGTYYFRVRRNDSGVIDTIFGLSDQLAADAPGVDTGSPWNEYAVMLSIFGDTGSSQLRAYSDGAGDVNVEGLANAEWVNVWLTVDNQAKTYRVATSTGFADGVDSGAVYNFGRRTSGDVGDNTLVTFGFYESRGVGAELDDLYFLPGADLTNPRALSPGLLGETLTVDGDLHLEAGASLELDLDQAAGDLVQVGGAALLEGDLRVVLRAGFTPALNQAFTVLTAGSLTNDLTLVGPDAALFSLAASTPTELILTAVSGLAGDFNNDGSVDAADYTVWRDNLGAAAGTLLNDPNAGAIGAAQYASWRDNFGAALSASAATAPEPAAAALAGLLLTLGAGRRRR